MCGIAGFTGEDRSRIEQMTAALKHRGPDGTAVEVRHGISFGHARLAILDPRPEGNQPMWNTDRSALIVYNGEIMNFRELRERNTLQCRTGTDTEVLLELYRKFGMAFLPQVRGMYAFALFDITKKILWLARDPSGIKPLYITREEGDLSFASETRSLMAGMRNKPAINTKSLSHYLRLQYVPGPETLCEGIESLPPGTLLSLEHGKEHRSTIMSETEEYFFGSKTEWKERFPAIMDDAVREHLVSDRPVGIFLSGGMDSSIALHHMCNHAQKPVRTFTVRFEATEEEGQQRFNADANLAKQTAAHYGTEHHEVLLTAATCRDIFHDTARAIDQPNADTVATAQVLLSREAKQHVDVVLCGAGGDELFGGYPRYRVARLLSALRPLPSAFRSLIAGVAGFPRDVLKLQPGPPLAERLLCRPEQECTSIIHGSWFDPLAARSLFQERYPQDHSSIRSFMEFDRKLWLVDESLRLMDGTTMSCGLEARIPFLDPRVIAAALATPAPWHATMCQTKALLKDTYRPLLPPHLFSLPKASFYPPMAKWIRRQASPIVAEALEHSRIHEYFNVEILRTLFQEHTQHKTYSLHPLMSVATLAAWFDAVYDAA